MNARTENVVTLSVHAIRTLPDGTVELVTSDGTLAVRRCDKGTSCVSFTAGRVPEYRPGDHSLRPHDVHYVRRIAKRGKGEILSNACTMAF